MLQSNLKTIRTDMNTLVRDAQDLFRAATALSGEKAEELRSRGIRLLDTAVEKAQDAQATALQSGKELAASTDDYVRKNPWRAISVAAAVGLLVGVVVSRK